MEAGAGVDHGVEVETTGEHENRAADRGCCVSTCSALVVQYAGANRRSILESRAHSSSRGANRCCYP